MKNVALRIYVVAAIVAGAYGVNRWLQVATAAPEVDFPEWSLKDMPIELGEWRGEDVEMDPEIAKATGAEIIVNRAYRNEAGQLVSLHSAAFKDPATGVYHSPMNCYVGNGWKKVSEEIVPVKMTEDYSVAVQLVVWEKGDDKILVGFWYQLGRHVFYSRNDLGLRIRWEMRGQDRWPVCFKLMMQTPVVKLSDARNAVLDFSEQLGRWLNQPDHQSYLSRWRPKDGV